MLHNDVALERLRYQGNDLCSNLATLISALREARDNQDGREEIRVLDNLTDTVLTRTGIGLDIDIEEMSGRGVWICVRNEGALHRHTYNQTDLEALAKKHPELVKRSVNNSAAWIAGKAVEYSVDYTKGYINFKDARIAEHLHLCVITTGILDDNTFTDYEIASSLLHEIGHVFFYYAMNGIQQHTCYVMQVALEALAQNLPKKESIKLVTTACEKYGIPSEYAGAFCDVRSDVGIQTIVDVVSKEKMQSILKVKNPNDHFEEYMADFFATMHGGGVPLVSVLKKIATKNYDDKYQMSRNGYYSPSETAKFFTFELFYMTAFHLAAVAAAWTVLSLGTAAIAGGAKLIGALNITIGASSIIYIYTTKFIKTVFTDSTKNETHPRPYDRYRAIRRALLQSLRTINNPVYTQSIINDIDRIGQFIQEESTKTRLTSVYETPKWLMDRMSGKNRNMDFIRELEDAVGNELHVESKRLGTLA